MLTNASKTKILLTAFFLSTTSHSALAASYSYSPQLVLTGVDKIHALGDYGQGVLFGDIDTGITPKWIGFNSVVYNGKTQNNINTALSAVCLNGICTSGSAGANITDGNGHGTFTASEIVGGVPSVGFSGYAPAGQLISVQVLSASGSGYSNDVANGITYAAGKGAEVLNLSLGPSGTAAQQAAFYQSLTSAVNAAAAKGVYMVFAGGNSAQAFSAGANISGFSDAALQHMLFMGSTNINEKLSSFSNTPSTGYFVSTTGKKYNYSSMWLMADGENIVGGSNYSTPQYGYSYITQMSGTSMAAPQGAGAIGLLLTEWPILLKTGTAANILEATGKNIGASTSYGSGFLNLVAAFNPIGNLTVTGSNKQTITVNSAGTVLTGGALGNIAGVKAILSNYTAFDSYQRNFALNLSSAVSNKPSTSPASVAISSPTISNSSVHFADGSSLAFGSAENDPTLADHPNAASDPKNMYASFTDSQGTTMAAGNGFPASASFASALWGGDGLVSSEVSALGVSNSLMNLAEGGKFIAFGSKVGKNTRVAFSWSASASNPATGNATANSFGAGLATNINKSWKAGLTMNVLNEQSGLLGTSYASGSALSLGNSHKSVSIGASSAFALGKKTDFLVDAALIRTNGANLDSSLISSVTPLYATSLGAALVQRDTLKSGDNLSLSVRAPMSVFSGSASMVTNSVDAGGNPIIGSQKVSLVPTGKEIDFSVGYNAPVDSRMSWNISFDARRNVNNIAGSNDVDALIGAKLVF